jgi:tRNA-dihydrouridine synthase A
MAWSDRHCRFFWRLLSKHSFLYTEMVTSGALIHGDRERFLRFHEEEHPVALQVGGSNPEDLARCAGWAEEWGYDEININCGCPSERVQSGSFGACLMAEPDVVAECVAKMKTACSIPVTVKHRIGIDDMESYESMLAFIDPIAQAGCETFIIHARKAWLQGLSPKENRDIPPLNYDWVYRAKRDRPDLEIIINGGIRNLADISNHLEQVDGVMLGREAYQNPYMLAEVDAKFFAGNIPIASREQILLEFTPYVARQLKNGVPLNHMTRHILGLFQKVPGAKQFRRHISENAHRQGAGVEVIYDALELVHLATTRAA